MQVSFDVQSSYTSITCDVFSSKDKVCSFLQKRKCAALTEVAASFFQCAFTIYASTSGYLTMQLSDRQCSHAQASSTSSPHAKAKPRSSGAGIREVWSESAPISFKKASSPDIPEPPHKKGSGQAHIPAQALHSPLRRKHPADSSRHQSSEASPATSPDDFQTANAPGLRAPEENGDSSHPHRSENGWHNKADSTTTPQRPSRSLLNEEALDLASKKILERLVLEDSAHTSQEAGPRGKDLTSQLKLGRLLGGRGKIEAALKLSHQLDLQYPTNPDVLCLRGDCFASLNSRAQVRYLMCNATCLLSVASASPKCCCLKQSSVVKSFI